MAYEQFKVIKTYDEFIDSWNPDTLADMNQEQKKDAYDKYVLKCIVFQRDNFTCQNENCAYCKNVPETELTMHHIKFKKNNGQDKEKNCITVCLPSHRAFHSGREALTFWGMTYKVHQEDTIDWKTVRAEARKIRKEWKQENPKGYYVSWEMLAMLMRFLNIPYYELYDESKW